MVEANIAAHHVVSHASRARVVQVVERLDADESRRVGRLIIRELAHHRLGNAVIVQRDGPQRQQLDQLGQHFHRYADVRRAKRIERHHIVAVQVAFQVSPADQPAHAVRHQDDLWLAGSSQRLVNRLGHVGRIHFGQRGAVRLGETGARSQHGKPDVETQRLDIFIQMIPVGVRPGCIAGQAVWLIKIDSLPAMHHHHRRPLPGIWISCRQRGQQVAAISRQ